MIVLSHRGYWRQPDEKNAKVAFERTLRQGFGTETDVRDFDGRLVVSHDPPIKQHDALAWSDIVEMFDGSGLPLAVNIKADGLGVLISESFDGRDIDWFAFDMSGPEMRRYVDLSLPVFTRHSDVEPEPIFYSEAIGVWLDSFGPTWFDCDVIERHLEQGKRVCIVSCELHGRNPDRLWDQLAEIGHSDQKDQLLLCTDRPELAKLRLLS
jgi:glycerophosphoryl diester phosphodiesterase